MIKELKIANWKSFDNAVLYIDPLTILIGTNASGKSNVLDALFFLQRVASGVGLFPAINGDVNLPPLRGGLEWICLKPEKRFTLEILVGESPKRDYRYMLTVQVNGTRAEVFEETLIQLTYDDQDKPPEEQKLFWTKQEDEPSPAIPSYFPTGKRGPAKRHDLNRSHPILVQAQTMKLLKDTENGVQAVLHELRRVFVFDPIPSHMRSYTPFSDRLQADGSNIAGVLAGLDEERRKSVEGTLTKYLKDLPERDIERVWTEPVGKFGTDAMLYCQEGWGGVKGHVVDARGMSDGTLRYLAIVVAMLTREEGSLLVVEEVDNGLHPSRAHILIDMLKTVGRERRVDVIITTHNPALLDAAGERMVPFITVAHRESESGASRLIQLEDIERLPKLMSVGSLGRLATEGRIELELGRENGK